MSEDKQQSQLQQIKKDHKKKPSIKVFIPATSTAEIEQSMKIKINQKTPSKDSGDSDRLAQLIKSRDEVIATLGSKDLSIESANITNIQTSVVQIEKRLDNLAQNNSCKLEQEEEEKKVAPCQAPLPQSRLKQSNSMRNVLDQPKQAKKQIIISVPVTDIMIKQRSSIVTAAEGTGNLNQIYQPTTKKENLQQPQLSQPQLVARHQSFTSEQVLKPKGGPGGTLGYNSKGVTASSIQTGGNLNTISNSNISINTSTQKNTIDEEDNLFSSEEDAANMEEEQQEADSCNNQRFVKHFDCISKSRYRTIHRGYDNESGCEIAWTTYPLHNYKKDRLLKALEEVRQIGQTQDSQNQHYKNILRVIYNEVRPVSNNPHAIQAARNSLNGAAHQHILHQKRPSIISNRSQDFPAMTSNVLLNNGQPQSTTISSTSPQPTLQQEELIVISELITAGSIREYLKKIKTLRLNIIRGWCRKVLEAVQYLHERDIVHGELSCETIYINSNNGEIKVGDVGIKHIHTKYSHELGSCKQYRKEKYTLKVDVFCFGLSLLEIVAGCETISSRYTLKYIIQIFNSGQKERLLDVLLNEPMKDFLTNALQEDPQRRFGVQQLLDHPFLKNTSATESKKCTQLSVGMAVLIKEQAAHFKKQRLLHQQSKNSNSLQLSALNDSSAIQKGNQSSQKKNSAQQNQKLQSSIDNTKQNIISPTLSLEDGSQQNRAETNNFSRACTIPIRPITDRVCSTINENSSDKKQQEKLLISGQLQKITSQNSMVQPYEAQMASTAPSGHDHDFLGDRKQSTNKLKIAVPMRLSMQAQSTSVKVLGVQNVIAQNNNQCCHEEQHQQQQQQLPYSQLSAQKVYRDVAHHSTTKGRSTSILEIPNQKQRLQPVYSSINTASKHSRQRSNALKSRSGLQYQHLRGKEGSFPSATYPSASQRRKISTGTGYSEQVQRGPSGGKVSSTGQQELLEEYKISSNEEKRRSDPSQIDVLEKLIETQQDVQQQNEEVYESIEQQNERASFSQPESPTQTQSNNENILNFRIQIQMKGKKSDVKFPFDLLKDSPEAVVNELQDYFRSEGSELPPRAVDAIRKEIQHGIDSHNMYSTSNTEISQAQTQHSYQNTVVISKISKESNKRRPIREVQANFEESKEPILQQPQYRNSYAHQEAQIQNYQQQEEYFEDYKQHPPINSGKNQREKELLEERAQRQEQEEMELRLAHDYLSSKPQLQSQQGSDGTTYSLPVLDASGYEQSEFVAAAASMQVEFYQMLKDGQLNETDDNQRMQLANRKVSTSHEANEQQTRYKCANDGTSELCQEQRNQQMIAALNPDEEPPTENSAAMIDFSQNPHNNTTGERHEKMIKKHQENGPCGQRDILHDARSIDYYDPDLINFMHNPDEDLANVHPLIHNKDNRGRERRGSQLDSCKSEAQESLWLLRELFPGYMERYHEDYVTNQMNTQNLHLHQPTLQQLSAAEVMHTSQYTMDLSFRSIDGSHCYLDSQKDLQVQGLNDPPFQADLSIIQQNTNYELQLQGAHQHPASGMIPVDPQEQRGVKPASSSGALLPVTGDSSSQLQFHTISDLDEAQVKNIAQQAEGAKVSNIHEVANVRSFVHDFTSESFLREWVIRQPAIPRPPSGQSLLSLHPQQYHGQPRINKLNNSELYNHQQVANFVSATHYEKDNNTMRSFCLLVNPSMARTAMGNYFNAAQTLSKTTATIAEITQTPNTTNPQHQQTNGGGGGPFQQNSHLQKPKQPSTTLTSGTPTTQEILHLQTETVNTKLVTAAVGVTGDVQLNSQTISDSHSPQVQHAIAYGKDQSQPIQVLNKSSQNSMTETSGIESTKLDEVLSQLKAAGNEKNAAKNLMERRQTKQIFKQPSSSEAPAGTIEEEFMQQQQQNQQKVPEEVELPQLVKMTPSITDIQRSASQKGAENALKDINNAQASLKNRLQISIKEFQLSNMASAEDTNTYSHQQLTDAQDDVDLSRHRNYGTPSHDDDSSKATIESTSPTMRFSKQPVVLSTASTAMQQDLQRLQEIRSKGMRSELLQKGYSQMKRADISNLKFALGILGFSCQQMGGANSSSHGDKSAELMALDKSSASINDKRHFDRYTRANVKRFKKQNALTNDSTVDRDTWDIIIDCAIQKARLLCNVSASNLESVQEQEEDQKAEEPIESQLQQPIGQSQNQINTERDIDDLFEETKETMAGANQEQSFQSIDQAMAEEPLIMMLAEPGATDQVPASAMRFAAADHMSDHLSYPRMRQLHLVFNNSSATASQSQPLQQQEYEFNNEIMYQDDAQIVPRKTSSGVLTSQRSSINEILAQDNRSNLLRFKSEEQQTSEQIDNDRQNDYGDGANHDQKQAEQECAEPPYHRQEYTPQFNQEAKTKIVVRGSQKSSISSLDQQRQRSQLQ